MKIVKGILILKNVLNPYLATFYVNKYSFYLYFLLLLMRNMYTSYKLLLTWMTAEGIDKLRNKQYVYLKVSKN